MVEAATPIREFVRLSRYRRDMSLLAELSYDAALRALDLQERGLGELRQRTGTLLAASSLTASFLGAQTIQHTASLGVLEALALVGLAGSIGSATYVLIPKRRFEFSVNAITQFEALFELGGDDDEVRRRLIYWLEGLWSSNQDKIDDIGRYFFVAAVSLVMQLVFWTWALAANLT
jgi:hypothetical protein